MNNSLIIIKRNLERYFTHQTATPVSLPAKNLDPATVFAQSVTTRGIGKFSPIKASL